MFCLRENTLGIHLNLSTYRYEIRNAGVQSKVLQEEKFDGATFEVTTGDYSQLLALVADNLESAVVRSFEFKIAFLPLFKVGNQRSLRLF